MMAQENCPYSNLLRRVEITSKSRYYAARRMSIHGWLTQWTLAILAVGQIVISLIPALSLRINFSVQYLNFGTILFGVLVLTYSLLLGMSNFSSRSIKLHECGIELGLIALKLRYLSSNEPDNNQEYDKLCKEYYTILAKNENHTLIDYIMASHEYYNWETYNKNIGLFECCRKNIDYFCMKFQCYSIQILQFSHYIISVILEWIWIYFLIKK